MPRPLLVSPPLLAVKPHPEHDPRHGPPIARHPIIAPPLLLPCAPPTTPQAVEPHPGHDPLHGPPPALPPGTEKHCRVRVLAPSVIKFVPEPPATPGGPPRTRMHMQMYVDPGIKHVPSFIITFVLKVGWAGAFAGSNGSRGPLPAHACASTGTR